MISMLRNLMQLISNIDFCGKWIDFAFDLPLLLERGGARGSYCSYQAGIYLLNVSNRNNRTMCEVCSKLTMKTHE